MLMFVHYITPSLVVMGVDSYLGSRGFKSPDNGWTVFHIDLL